MTGIIPMEAAIPELKNHLPDLSDFVRIQARQIEAGELRNGDELGQRIRDFHTPGRMRSVEAVSPGWLDMAAYADGATLDHITRALIALQCLPEYRQAPPHLQAAMEWIVLYHDVGKQVIDGQRDSLHAFRSATLAARALPKVGFQTSENYAPGLDAWIQLVLGASIAAPDGKGSIQDNRKLPAIILGSEQLFGAGTGAALIVQAVLLHQSLNVVPEWPNPGSLTDTELPSCISPALLPLLEALMLVDSDAWQLFDPASKAKFRQSTLAVFAGVRRMTGS
jgi:hypothetical protein